jgi:hypothetical protein
MTALLIGSAVLIILAGALHAPALAVVGVVCFAIVAFRL